MSRRQMMLMARQFGRPALERRVISLVLILSVVAPMTGSLQILPAANGDGPVVMTLNVCETGVPMANAQGLTPCILQVYGFAEPQFYGATENGEEQRLTDTLLLTSLDRPPRAG